MPAAAFPAPRFAAPQTPCNLALQRCPVPRERAEKRILILRAGAIGDILMADATLVPRFALIIRPPTLPGWRSIHSVRR